MPLPDWSRAYGAPLAAATIRMTPADFDVTEILGFDFDGDGEHDYLYVEKTSANTHWVAGQLAQFAKVPARDVGYSGLKDRDAVTRQWFSVPRWHAPDWVLIDIEGVSILTVERHSRKLRRGAHRSNRFKIILSEIETSPAAPAIEQRLQQIASQGVPNYFGPQRFGRGGGNVELANQWSRGKRMQRDKRSMAISTARSFLFNENLHARVLDGTWNQIQSGDTANLDGTGSIFSVDAVDEELIRRCQELDIHPTGLLHGDGTGPSDLPSEYGNWLAALTKARVKVAHRSLRLRLYDFRWTIDNDRWVLEFDLGRGAYATSVLREIASC